MGKQRPGFGQVILLDGGGQNPEKTVTCSGVRDAGKQFQARRRIAGQKTLRECEGLGPVEAVGILHEKIPGLPGLPSRPLAEKTRRGRMKQTSDDGKVSEQRNIIFAPGGWTGG